LVGDEDKYQISKSVALVINEKNVLTQRKLKFWKNGLLMKISNVPSPHTELLSLSVCTYFHQKLRK
jgi:hypothetical protein